ncbi:MAG: OadG family protein [Desulforhopalus sp.]|nr:OadG family protein [Desulforhopalus sp.]
MGISELLVQLANPEAIKTLSFTEKMAGGLLVTFLGMGITFLALILLQVIIDLLARIMVKMERPAEEVGGTVLLENTALETVEKDNDEENSDEEEIVAVITAAVAMQMQTAAENVVIRNIRKIEVPATQWRIAGILDQMNTRL